MKENRNYCQCIIKYVASCFVVFIHTKDPSLFGETMDCLARFAVPFFFLISGYYSYDVPITDIKKRIKKIIRLYLAFFCVYFIWDCYYNCFFIANSNFINYFLSTFTLKRFSLLIFMGEIPFVAHLWYLPAMIIVYSVFITYISFWYPSEHITYKNLYLVAICTYLFHIAFSLKATGTGLEISYFFYRNGLFFAFPIFCLGLFIHNYQDRLNKNFKFDIKKCLYFIGVGCTLSIIQWFGLGKVEMPIGMMLVIIGLFQITLLCSQISIEKRSTALLIRYIEKSSVIVYLFHPLVSKIIKAFSSVIPSFSLIVSEGKLFSLYIIVISSIFALLTVIIVDAIRNFRHLSVYKQ